MLQALGKSSEFRDRQVSRNKSLTTGVGLTLVGVTRFSVDPASIIEPDREHNTLAALREAVYDPVRLRNRFKLFQEFTLPSMMAAARQYPEFHYVVLISPRLPAYYRLRLYLMQLNKTWFHLRIVGEKERLSDVTRRTMAQIAGKNRIFNFRIDDDDAIRPRFIDKVVELSERHSNGTIVSFDLGYYVQRLNSSRVHLHKQNYPKIAIGLGIFSDPGSPACIYEQGVHQKIAAERVTNVRDDYYWIRTLHAQNDSGRRAKEASAMPIREACDRLLPEFSHLSLERALLALPATDSVGTDKSALRALFGIQ